MVQDTSMIHERLAYEAFRSVGVPSPRTGYAYLEVNGEDFGLHLNIETTDDVALEKRLGAFDHLYEGAYGSDVAPGGAGSFEIDEGDEERRRRPQRADRGRQRQRSGRFLRPRARRSPTWSR